MKKEYDVVVIGGGPGGFSAAAAAARAGASVVLVERYGFLGGMATSGLVNPFMQYKLNGKNLASGVFRELLERISKAGALHEEGYIFDDEVLKVILDRLMADCGVEVLLHSYLADVRSSDGAIESVGIAGKSPGVRLRGGIFIDATGDGDLAALAGCETEKGRDIDGMCQPMTLCFRIGGVDVPAGPDHLSIVQEELNLIFREGKEAGELEQPRENVLMFETMTPGAYHFNTTRVTGADAVDATDLSRAETEGRRQALELFNYFKEKSPRFANSYILKMAAQIGVRESRRVKGMYRLTEDDVLSARKFEDGIARCCYSIDIHNPSGEGTVIKPVPAGDYYEVPFRALIPEGAGNLLIGSRCISSSHEAHSSFRIMPVVSGIGEASGLAAAKAVKAGSALGEIDGKELKKELLS